LTTGRADPRLVTSLGFNPNGPLDLTQPAPQEQELVFAPQQPFQVPVYGGVPEHYPSIQGVAEQTMFQQLPGLQQTMAPPAAPTPTADLTATQSSASLPFERAFASGDWFTGFNA
jgi:hypothetical protein